MLGVPLGGVPNVVGVLLIVVSCGGTNVGVCFLMLGVVQIMSELRRNSSYALKTG